MTKTEIYLVITGTVVSSALVYGLTADWHSNSASSHHTANALSKATSTAEVQKRGSSDSAQAAENGPAMAISSVANPSPLDAATVRDQALLRLAGMVNIANSPNEPPNKDDWQQALPIAQKLLEEPCDCAQRNWLTHYVEMGNYAVAGSLDEYNKSAQGIVTLGRNNNQAVAITKGDRFWATK